MLQFTRHNSLAMQIRNLLDLKRTFQSGRVLAPTTQQQQTLLVLEELLAQSLDALVQLQDLAELVRDARKGVHDGLAAFLLGRTVFGKRESEHHHRDELGGVCLGGSNTDFGTGVDVHAAVSEEGDG